MFATLDFGMLPPEINSARMYSGAGSRPLLAAASAWNALAAELRSAALSYGSTVSALTGEEWRGPASAAMTAAAAPYVAWMTETAAHAERTATQAEAAATAFEAAFAATVPPPVVTANRAQLATLVATNVLGQNTAAIAATEAQYSQMWAQDAAAMFGYAGSSAAATRLTPFTDPRQNTSSNGPADQAAAVAAATGTSVGNHQTTLSHLSTAVPNALQSLASPAGSNSSTSSTSSTSGLASILDPNSNFWNTLTSTGAFNPTQVVQAVTGSTLMGTSTGASADVAAEAAPSAAAGLGTRGLSSLAGLGGAGSSVSAGLGRASLIGPLSVPPSWTAPAPLTNPLASTLGGTPMTAPPPALAAGMPGIPFGSSAGPGHGRAVPQYGFRPTFVARPPAAG